MRDAVSVNPPSQTLKLVIFTPPNVQEADRALAWLERQHQVLSGGVRPILLLDAADTGLREVATRRARTPEAGVWLTAWGSEMLRIHLHNIEKNDLDTKPHRAAILKETGGIPTETINLVSAIVQADAPEEVIAGWKAALRNVAEITAGLVGPVLAAVDEVRKRDDYQAMDELIRESHGPDLLTIGPDLVAMGLISGWNHAAHRIRRSALGNLIAERIELRE